MHKEGKRKSGGSPQTEADKGMTDHQLGRYRGAEAPAHGLDERAAYGLSYVPPSASKALGGARMGKHVRQDIRVRAGRIAVQPVLFVVRVPCARGGARRRRQKC